MVPPQEGCVATASASTPLSPLCSGTNSVNRSRSGSNIDPEHGYFSYEPRARSPVTQNSANGSSHLGHNVRAPRSPSAVTAESSEFWPATPTLTTAADISAPSTPVPHGNPNSSYHNHVITAAFAAAHRARQLGESITSSAPFQHSAVANAANVAAAAAAEESRRSAGQQQQHDHHQPLPTEQLKRHWLKTWIHDQPSHTHFLSAGGSSTGGGSQFGFSSTNPSRSTSPAPPAATGVDKQVQTDNKDASAKTSEPNSATDSLVHQIQAVHVSQPAATSTGAPPVPTLEAMQRYVYGLSDVPDGANPPGAAQSGKIPNYGLARRQSWQSSVGSSGAQA